MRGSFWIFVGGIVYALALIGTAVIGVEIGDRNPPITYEAARALEKSVPQGGSIDIEYQVYRWRICKAVAKRLLIDSAGDVHNIAAYTVGLSPFTGKETYRRTITIPDEAEIGPALYHVTIDYYCNPFHRLGFPITVDAPAISFDITKSLSLVPFGLQNQSGGG